MIFPSGARSLKPIAKAFLFLVPLLAATTGQATTISGPTDGEAATSAVLPSAVGTDWGYWVGTSPVPASATNTSTAGSLTFDVTTVGGGTTRGSTTLANTAFTFTNGTSPASGTALQVGGVFNTLLGPANLNTGVQMTLTGIASHTQFLLYTYLFQSTGTLNVYLNGSSTASYTDTLTDSTGGKIGFRYIFDYVPDSAADTVRFEYIKTGSFDNNSNVGFLAAAVVPVPEPSAVALGLLSSAGLMAIRRRRRS